MSVQAKVRQSLSVVLVARDHEDEAARLAGELVREVGAGCTLEVVVVFAGPPHPEADRARAAGARVVQLATWISYAEAQAAGLRSVRHELVALLDPGDGYRPHDLSRLLSQAGRHDMVVGVRALGGRAGLGRRLARLLLRRTAELVTGQVVPDPTSGFRILRRSAYLRYAPLAGRGMGLSSILTVGMLLDGHSVAFVPIQHEGQPSGRLRPIRGWIELAHLMARLVLLFNPLRVLALPGYALAIAGAILVVLSGVATGEPGGWGVLLFLTGALVLAVAFLADALGAIGRAAIGGRRD